MQGQEMLKVEGLCKRFGQLEVLRGVGLEVDRGETVAIIGPSGSGKSTLLRCINYQEKIEAGSIIVEGAPMVQDGVYAGESEIRAMRRLSLIHIYTEDDDRKAHAKVLQHFQGDHPAEGPKRSGI